MGIWLTEHPEPQGATHLHPHLHAHARTPNALLQKTILFAIISLNKGKTAMNVAGIVKRARDLGTTDLGSAFTSP